MSFFTFLQLMFGRLVLLDFGDQRFVGSLECSGPIRDTAFKKLVDAAHLVDVHRRAKPSHDLISATKRAIVNKMPTVVSVVPTNSCFDGILGARRPSDLAGVCEALPIFRVMKP